MSQFNLFKDLPQKEDPFVDGVVLYQVWYTDNL